MDEFGIDTRLAVAEATADLVRFLIGAVQAVIVALIAVRLAAALRRRVEQGLARTRLDATARAAASNGVAIAVYVAATVLIVALVGGSWSAVLAILGAGAVVFAIALQDVLRSLVAGAYLQMELPVAVGDRVRIGDYDGTVEAVGLRSTVLRTDTDERIFLPSLTLFTEIVASRRGDRTGQTVLALSGVDIPPTELPAAIEQALAGLDGVRGTPKVKVIAAGAQGVDATILVTHAPRGDVAPALLTRLHDRFPAATISVLRS